MSFSSATSFITRTWEHWGGVIVGLAVGFVIVGIGAHILDRTSADSAAAHAACVSSNVIRKALTSQLYHTLLQLHHPSAATAKLYAQNPGLLKESIADTQRFITAMAQLPC